MDYATTNDIQVFDVSFALFSGFKINEQTIRL